MVFCMVPLECSLSSCLGSNRCSLFTGQCNDISTKKKKGKKGRMKGQHVLFFYMCEGYVGICNCGLERELKVQSKSGVWVCG